MFINLYCCCWDIAFFQVSSFSVFFVFIQDITLDFLKILFSILVCSLTMWTCSLQTRGDSSILIKMVLGSYSCNITSHWYMMLIKAKMKNRLPSQLNILWDEIKQWTPNNTTKWCKLSSKWLWGGSKGASTKNFRHP